MLFCFVLFQTTVFSRLVPYSTSVLAELFIFHPFVFSTYVNQSYDIWYVTSDCCQKDLLLYRIFGGFYRDVCASSGCLRSHLPNTLHCHCLWWQNSRTAHQRVWVMLRLTVDQSWCWAPFWSSWPDARMHIGNLLLSIMVPIPTREWVCPFSVSASHIHSFCLYAYLHSDVQ
jgi:hypothetical protein